MSQAEAITATEVASLLGVSRKKVYEAATTGEIPCRRLGRRILFSRIAVLEWLHGRPANDP